MQTLKVSNGDFVLDGGNYGVVEGQDKLRQDLWFALAEPIGCDRFHSTWGSILSLLVGQPSTVANQTKAQSDASRVVSTYATAQRQAVTSASLSGRSQNYALDELITSVKNVEVAPSMDRLNLVVRLTTGDQGNVAIFATAAPSA